MSLVAASCLALFVLLGLAFRYLLFPLRYTHGIPTIPFWVALLPLLKDVDQQDIFRQYIEQPLRKHGAAKIFFAAQWNILVHRPSYMAEIFRQEDVYQKSGNQNKIPRSVLASFLGDNVISSHGKTWRHYHRIIKPGLQTCPDLDVLFRNAHKLRSILVQSQTHCRDRGVGIQSSIQRYTIANLAQSKFGVDFGTMASAYAYLHQVQYKIKKDIFRPIFMNFPFLDSLGLPSRQRARMLAGHFTDQLVAGLEQSCIDDKRINTKSNLSRALVDARRDGVLTEKQFRDNATVLFVAGQENPQLSIISTLYLLAKHPEVQEDLHTELGLRGNDQSQVTQECLQSMPLLAAVVYESIRLFPPIGQLINRRVAQPVHLGGDVFIPKGTYVGYNCYSTNRDPEAWGADSNDFRPERWGSTTQGIQKEYRRRRARAEFISFHGGQRACLGERFALLQLKITLYVLIKSFKWKLDPAWRERMTPAGPLCPRDLHLVFEQRQE